MRHTFPLQAVPLLAGLLTACHRAEWDRQGCPRVVGSTAFTERPATQPLAARDSARIVLRLHDGVHPRRAVEGARVRLLGPGDSVAGVLHEVAPGELVVAVAAVAQDGAYTLEIRRIGYSAWRQSIRLRVGYADTVTGRLQRSRACLVRMRPMASASGG